MTETSKKDLAVAFLGQLATMPREQLQTIIQQTVGDELAAVMFGYSKQVMEADPKRAMENASSLIVLGYLLRAHEKGELPRVELPA